MEFKDRIDELAGLMDEFHLAEARLEWGGSVVRFRRRSAVKSNDASEVSEAEESVSSDFDLVAPQEPQKAGTPVPSPMTGIYYDAASPTSAPFVRVGDEVSVGQTIGLIEAMKVFNEIPCPISGIVVEIPVESGQIVQPGETILWVG